MANTRFWIISMTVVGIILGMAIAVGVVLGNNTTVRKFKTIL